MSDEFYTRPVIHVSDVEASIAYYSEKLGFSKAWGHDWNEKPIIAQVNRNGLDLILDSASVIPRAGKPTVLSLSLHEPDRLGALHEEFKQRGARIVSPPAPVIWDKTLHQLVVEDLDGNKLVFWGNKPA